MILDFPVNKISFIITEKGSGKISILLNGMPLTDREISSSQLKPGANDIQLVFEKDDPADISSYATVDGFIVNDLDLTEQFKSIEYFIDQSQHKGAEISLQNNCYFGYIGKLQINLDNESLPNDLKKAAWLIAQDHFSYVKHPYKGHAYKHRSYLTVHDEAKHMFAGVHPAKDNDIYKYYSGLEIRECDKLIDTRKLKKKLEKWLVDSNRLNFKGLENFPHMNVTNGNSESIASYILRNNQIGICDKMYQFSGDLIKNLSKKTNDIMKEIIPGQKVLFEFPSVHYSSDELHELMIKCRQKECYIALDLTFLPVITKDTELDLGLVDEFYFGMTKTWALYNIRPGFRFSKKNIQDNLSWVHEHNYFPTIGVNIFDKLIEKFSIDYTYNKFKNTADEVKNYFNLGQTDILWATTTSEHSNNISNLGDNWHLNKIISINKLLEHQGEYFW